LDPNLRALAVRLLALIPDDDAAVALATQHRMQGRRRPRARPTPSRARRQHAALIEVLGDGSQPESGAVLREDAANDLRLNFVDRILDVSAVLAVVALHVVVPKDATTNVEAPTRLRHQMFVCTTADLLTLELSGERLSGHHELRGRIVEPNPLATDVVVKLHARIEHVLDE
jgi:hypothetical protein